jgi:sugar/nucleoside kinase (ribokinase family)
MTGLEVITMGRVSADIYPEQAGVGLEDVTSFRKFLGGTATNVAVAAARYGHRCAVITRVGDGLGITLAVVKQGPGGVLAADDSGLVQVPPVRVQVVNGLGAGDAFGGALCHGLLRGQPADPRLPMTVPGGTKAGPGQTTTGPGETKTSPGETMTRPEGDAG